MTTVAVLVSVATGCQNLDRFDTKDGQAYCGSIVDGYLRTSSKEGGLNRIRLTAEIDTSQLTTTPVRFTTHDSDDTTNSENHCTVPGTDGGTVSVPLFDHAPLRVTPEVASDTLSTMTFEEGQVQNLVGWVDSACRGTMLAIVSLYKNDRVEARFLIPKSSGQPSAVDGDRDRDAFALFALTRDGNCPF